MKFPSALSAAVALSAGVLAVPAPAQDPIFTIGEFNGTQTEFEQESDSYNNPQYYAMPGDYTGVNGFTGPGEDFPGPDPEILQDGPGAEDWGVSADGFPRALVPGRPIIEVFFQLTAEQAQEDYLFFHTILMGLGGGSSHNVVFFLNGVPIHFEADVQGETPVEIFVPREGVLAAGWGAPFYAGGNVLTFQRQGGGPIDPADFGEPADVDHPWVQFDAVELSVVASPPANPPAVYRNLFTLGFFDNNNAEFEQESGAYNNPQYYTAAGDFTAAEGMSGFGEDFPGPDAEVLQDGPTADDWAITIDGFPRAVVPGRPIVDIFFLLDEQEAATDTLIFSVSLALLGANSTHDMEFSLNGSPFYTVEQVRFNHGVMFKLERGPDVTWFPGANVVSMVRLGGGLFDPGGEDAPWIQFDAVSMSMALPDAGAPPGPAAPFRISSVARDAQNGSVTLTWPAENGKSYAVDATDNPAGTWTVIAPSLQAGQYTDSAVPAGAAVRYYRVRLLP